MIVYGVYEKFTSGWAGDAEGLVLLGLFETQDSADKSAEELRHACGRNSRYRVKEVFVNE